MRKNIFFLCGISKSYATTFITFPHTRGNFISVKIISLPHCELKERFDSLGLGEQQEEIKRRLLRDQRLVG